MPQNLDPKISKSAWNNIYVDSNVRTFLYPDPFEDVLDHVIMDNFYVPLEWSAKNGFAPSIKVRVGTMEYSWADHRGNDFYEDCRRAWVFATFLIKS